MDSERTHVRKTQRCHRPELSSAPPQNPRGRSSTRVWASQSIALVQPELLPVHYACHSRSGAEHRDGPGAESLLGGCLQLSIGLRRNTEDRGGCIRRRLGFARETKEGRNAHALRTVAPASIRLAYSSGLEACSPCRELSRLVSGWSTPVPYLKYPSLFILSGGPALLQHWKNNRRASTHS